MTLLAMPVRFFIISVASLIVRVVILMTMAGIMITLAMEMVNVLAFGIMAGSRVQRVRGRRRGSN